jgi:hypothetical protein
MKVIKTSSRLSLQQTCIYNTNYLNKYFPANNLSTKLIKQSHKTFFFESYIKRNKLYVQHKKVSPELVEYFEPTEPVVFKDKKYIVLESPDTDKMSNFIQYGALLPLSMLSGYKLITSIINFKILGSICWGVIFTGITRLMLGFIQNKHFMIKVINLLEDGKMVEIETFAQKFNVDISDIRKVTPEEALYYSNVIGGNDFFPIVVKDEIFILSKGSLINDKTLFSAISNGNYIKLTQEKTVGKDDTIDIE